MNIRDDLSVCSGRSTSSFRRFRKDNRIDFRDDLSEYSHPSHWGETGPLSVHDHRLAAEGLEVRRTVGEAILHAQERELAEIAAEKCSCIRSRTARFVLQFFGLKETPRRWSRVHGSLDCAGVHRHARLDAWNRMWLHRRTRPVVVFTWADVQSVILLPVEGSGPCLTAVWTSRPEGSREWLLQSGSTRARARWALEMVAVILRHRVSAASSATCKCCGTGSAGYSVRFTVDMAFIACEVARFQPSAEGLARLIEVLDILSEGWGQPADTVPLPHFPLGALRRFRDTAKHAHTDVSAWQRWVLMSRLSRPPSGWAEELWHTRVMSFLCPQKDWLEQDSLSYPAAVNAQLADAAGRCRQKLAS